MTVPIHLLVCLQRDFQSLQLSWHKTFHGCANRQTCVSSGSCFNEPQGLTANLALLRAAICWSQENYLFQDLNSGAVCKVVGLQCLESITTPFPAVFSSYITWDTIHFSPLKTNLSSLYPSGNVDHSGAFATDFGRLWFKLSSGLDFLSEIVYERTNFRIISQDFIYFCFFPSIDPEFLWVLQS